MEDKHKNPVRETPHRSPKAVSDAVKDIIQNKTVCELGCAEGDNMFFMEEHASKVVGMELMKSRYQVAQQRGLEITVGNYHEDPLPQADVYYFWPDDGERDNEKLVQRILADESFHGTIIVGGDTGFPKEVPSVKRCARLGRLLEVPFNEGDKPRQSGIFLLAIIDADEARRFNEEKRVPSRPKLA